MNKEEIIYFEFNDWTPDKGYPACEPYESWLGLPAEKKKLLFRDDKWLRSQQIIVVESIIDMSLNFCVTAPLSWVQKNCPSLLTKYKQYIVKPEKNGKIVGSWGCPFKSYTKENLGYWYAGWDQFNNWNPEREK